ncbi:MAG TPA: AIPR family protein [Brumimicrobium sp.]|nr:AIPR family protein [Brumimicrobium sp.]
MYNKILSEIKQPYYQQQFSNDGQRFIAWYLRNVHLRDMNQAKDEITDGADDKQIDAIFVDDDNSTVYVIQGKFYNSDSIDAEPLREVLASWVQLKNLVRLQETGNNKLKRKLSEVAIAFEDEYDVAFEIITTGTLTPSAHNDLSAFQQELAESDDFIANIHLVDNEELIRRYDMALEQENPLIKHTIILDKEKFFKMEIAGNDVVLAAVPLKECIKIPGIKDGTLFQKNVRQSLGLSNRVNKGIKHTIYGSNTKDFFFYHNGVTAICNKLEINDKSITCSGLSIVNGCQSLNTILSCSEKVKTIDDSFILFRFYEVSQRDRADKISVSTNSQSAVKPRDLRSNDKRVLNLKKVFEQKYPNGYLITKRGEIAGSDKDKNFILDLSEMGKYLISWHSQRPNIAYSETKIFDKYFEQLFKRDYSPEKAQSLNLWMKEVWKRWGKDNPLGLNESLLAMRSYAPYHHLYGISICFAVSNNISEGVPNPEISYERAKQHQLIEQIVDIAGSCLNSALEAAANEPQPANRVFSPQNWIKTKSCLAGIRAATRQYFNMLPTMPGGRDLSQRLKDSLKIENEHFEARWAAD